MDGTLWSQSDHQYQYFPRRNRPSTFSYKNAAAEKNPLNNIIWCRGGFKRTDPNDTESDSTTLVASPLLGIFSSGWQRAINLRWSLDHFTQGEITNTTMLFYLG